MTGLSLFDGQQAATLDHVVDFYRRYPGEAVTLYTRIQVEQPVAGFSLRISIPSGLILEDYGVLQGQTGLLPAVEPGEGVMFLIWQVTEPIPPPSSYEYQLTTRVAPALTDIKLASQATLTLDVGLETEAQVTEVVPLAVSARGAYLKYLPGLYQRDELMGRFIMLFESFIGPLEEQLENLPFYFDPAMTPSTLLPWLASWLDLVLNERWEEEKQRQLIQSAIQLYRKRGTKAGLQKYLEIYTGTQPQIIEYSANNFVLGPEARLGKSVALGTGNQPYSFKVILHLPPIPAATEADAAYGQAERQAMIETIIESEKPAHTIYTLEIETDTHT
jgi:phage tail-like protein